MDSGTCRCPVWSAGSVQQPRAYTDALTQPLPLPTNNTCNKKWFSSFSELDLLDGPPPWSVMLPEATLASVAHAAAQAVMKPEVCGSD